MIKTPLAQWNEHPPLRDLDVMHLYAMLSLLTNELGYKMEFKTDGQFIHDMRVVKKVEV